MRLNLGSGDRPVPGWHNVDHAGCPHPADERVDLTGPLPWPPQSVELVYCGHLLEHLHWAQCRHLLKALLPVMRPGGQIMVVGPDIARAQAILDAGGGLEVPMGALKAGSCRWPGDEHRWDATPAAVGRLLQLAGWVEVRHVAWDEVDAVWPVAERGPRWQYAVTATAPTTERP